MRGNRIVCATNPPASLYSGGIGMADRDGVLVDFIGITGASESRGQQLLEVRPERGWHADCQSICTVCKWQSSS